MRKGIEYPLADEKYRHLPGTVVVSTGEYRQPKRGEWYISGAIPEGYRALRDLKDNHWIGVLKRNERAALKERLRTGKIVNVDLMPGTELAAQKARDEIQRLENEVLRQWKLAEEARRERDDARRELARYKKKDL